jgi:hypothetical protein
MCALPLIVTTATFMVVSMQHYNVCKAAAVVWWFELTDINE